MEEIAFLVLHNIFFCLPAKKGEKEKEEAAVKPAKEKSSFDDIYWMELRSHHVVEVDKEAISCYL